MRTRTEIEGSQKETIAFHGLATTIDHSDKVILEVLLDIRDLLANPGVQNDYGEAKNALT